MTIDGCVTGFRNAAGAASMLLPGATYTSRGGGLQLKEPVAALSLTPSIVVFEDGSATGDEAKSSRCSCCARGIAALTGP